MCLHRLKRGLEGAPLLIPLLVVAGSILAPAGYGLAGCAFLLGGVCRLWRTLVCALLCGAVSWLYLDVQAEQGRAFCCKAEQENVLQLEGMVAQVLERGFILDKGWCRARVMIRGKNMLYTPGDYVRIVAQWKEPEPSPPAGCFDEQRWLRSLGVDAALYYISGEQLGRPLWSVAGLRQWGNRMRFELSRRLMPPGTESDAARQILCALVLGDKSSAEDSTMEGFRRSGTLHAFAVSGMHVALVGGMLWCLFRWLHVHPAYSRWLVLLIIGVYVVMTGCSVPAVRSYLILAVLMLGTIFRRRVTWVNTLSFAALLILLWAPNQLFNAGFQLSFSAYAAICLTMRYGMDDSSWLGPDSYIPRAFYTRWERRLSMADYSLRCVILVSVSAWLVTVPITLLSFHTVNTNSILTNLAITPLLPVVMSSGLLLLLVSGIPWVGAVAEWVACRSAEMLLAVAAWFGNLPYAYLPAERPAAAECLVVQGTGYGESFTMLGNPGVLVNSGSEGAARFSTEPVLFHGGFTPAVLFCPRDTVASAGGVELLQQRWPALEVLRGTRLPAEGIRLRTQAGMYTFYPAPADIPSRNSANLCGIVLWEYAGRRVLYVGDASYLSYAALPQEAKNAHTLILGKNPVLPVADAEELSLPGGVRRIILLPSAAELPLNRMPLPPGVCVIRVGEREHRRF